MLLGKRAAREKRRRARPKRAASCAPRRRSTLLGWRLSTLGGRLPRRLWCLQCAGFALVFAASCSGWGVELLVLGWSIAPPIDAQHAICTRKKMSCVKSRQKYLFFFFFFQDGFSTHHPRPPNRFLATFFFFGSHSRFPIFGKFSQSISPLDFSL